VVGGEKQGQIVFLLLKADAQIVGGVFRVWPERQSGAEIHGGSIAGALSSWSPIDPGKHPARGGIITAGGEQVGAAAGMHGGGKWHG
jgi:hypothetical protein